MVSFAVLIIIVAWTVSFFFATLFECNGSHFDRLWISLQTYKQDCGKYKNIQLGHCVSDVATDLIVLSMPLPLIWKLHMRIQLKIVLSFIFLLGLLYVHLEYALNQILSLTRTTGPPQQA